MYEKKLLLRELAKFLKYDGKFESLEEAKKNSNLPDEDFDFITQTIKNRIYPINWIKENIKVVHPRRGIIPFTLYPFQENALKVFLNKHFVLTLKSRQVGMSTLTQSLCLWCVMNFQRYNVLIISAGQRNAQKFLSDIKSMYDNIPVTKYKLNLTTDNASTLEFENGSKITALPSTSQAARGMSVNLFIIDEAAFIEKIDEVYQACYPTISRSFPKKRDSSGKPFGIIIISTPCGITGTGKWYYEMYNAALNKVSKFVPVKIHWSQVPEFDNDWYLDQCMQLKWDYQKIASELELSFISSGNTYIPSHILDSIATLEPLNKTLDDNFWIWEEPIEDETYVMGVDVAYGDGKDYSTIEVIKVSTLEQVAEYESNTIIVDDFSNIVIEISKLYNNALTNIERNAVGKVLIDKIVDKTSYVGINLYRDTNSNELVIKPGEISNYRTNIGTVVSGANRDNLLSNMYNIVLEKYAEALNNMPIGDDDKKEARAKFEALMRNKNSNNTVKKISIIKSERLLHQLLGFIIDEHGKALGDHDDLVMAFVHTLYCYTKNKPLLKKGLLESINKMSGFDKKREEKINLIKFMQRGDATIWKQYKPDELADIMEEENNIGKEQINNNNSNNRLLDVYKYTYGI